MLGQLDTFIAFVVVILGISLLITVLNHMVTAILGLRGANLRWGIQTLLEQVDTKLAADARQIAEEILQHPLISDSTMSKTQSWPIVGKFLGRWRKASAIKVGEFVQMLRRLAEPVPAAGAVHWRQRLTVMLRNHDEQAAARLQAATAAVQAVAPNAIDKIDQVAPQIASQVRQAAGDLELWFDSMMDRVSQRYAARLRVFTVIFAIIVAFALHLDAAILLDQIRSDPELRARLVASADTMSKEADLVLGASVASVYRNAAQRLENETPELKPAGDPPAFVSESDGAAWVSNHLQSLDEARKKAAIQKYEALVQEELKALTGRLGKEADAIKQTLEGAGLQLIPNYAKHTRSRDSWPDW